MKKNVGIYKIKNILTGDIYIGSSNNLSKRKSEHFRKLSINSHANIILQRAYNKYGEKTFSFELICHCENSLLLYLEQLYLNSMKPYYNIALSSSAPMAGRRHSKETKLKFKNRIIKKGKDSPSYGKKWTEEQRIKFIKIRTGEKRSEEFKIGVRKRNKELNLIKNLEPFMGKNKRKVYSSDNNEFVSLIECSLFYKVAVSTINDVLKGRSKTLLGLYHLSYNKEDLKQIDIRKCIRCDIIKNIDSFPRKINGIEDRHKHCNKCRRKNKPRNKIKIKGE